MNGADILLKGLNLKTQKKGGRRQMDNERIQTKVFRIRQLLESSVVYQVPRFQRPYSWSRVHWKTFLEDIENTCHLSKDGMPYLHFLGAIITMARPSGVEVVAPYILVDGQQRLITIALLLAAIRNRAAEAGLSSLSHELDKLLRNADEELELKVQPTEFDEAALRGIIRGTPLEELHSPIGNAYSFFTDKLKGRPPEELEVLAKALLDQTEVVRIHLSQGENAYRIFESLNYKGSPLTPADLVRNYLFMRLAAEGKEKEKETYEKVWAPVEEAYKKVFPPSPANSIPHLERMSLGIWHYVRTNGEEIPWDATYPALIDRLNATLKEGKATESFALELKDSLADYLFFERPHLETNPKLQRRLEAFRILGFGVAAPLVMALKQRIRKGVLDIEDADQVLAVMEAYYLHRILASVPTNTVGRTVLSVLKNGLLDEPNPAEKVRRFLKGLSGNRRWPDREELEKRNAERSIYVWDGGGRDPRTSHAYYILKRIEQYLWKKLKRKELPNLENLTLEHIMPRTLSEAWKAEIGIDWERTHKSHLNALGNLTLTGYNQEMGNKPFSEKLKVLRESTLSINQEYFRSVSLERWDEQAIRERTKWLLDLVYEIWPA